MHIIPQLRKLEHQFAQELVVIGVHSAKFTSEKDTENIRQAIRRYEIEHPVVNDRDFALWKAYGVHAWPTIVLIDPRGKVIGSNAGEFDYAPMEKALREIIAEFDREGLIDRTPLRLGKEKQEDTFLSFPGKVLADEPGRQLFIADSNHNRIVVTNLPSPAPPSLPPGPGRDGGGRAGDGSLTVTVQMVIGRGTAGFTDGDFFSAEFNHPQGMALDGEVLYVADTENHAVRKVDLARQTVETLAGTGKQARAFNVAGRGKAAALNSPWDLVFHQGVLYVAMAGFHQLWALDPRTGEARPYVGSGREGRVDGLLRSAALAQPSGIATDGRKLYFADSEASAIRTADLNSQGHVETLVGLGLFEFGDRDGTGEKVRLQHPLGVACHDGVLYVADTYNNKIKRLDPTTGTCSTFLGQGSAGYRDGSDPLFHEPGGLSVAGGQLYIADTNNHALRVADLTTREVTTLTLKQPSP